MEATAENSAKQMMNISSLRNNGPLGAIRHWLTLLAANFQPALNETCNRFRFSHVTPLLLDYFCRTLVLQGRVKNNEPLGMQLAEFLSTSTSEY